MNKISVAAAASLDGRIGDGVIPMNEEAESEEQSMRLHNHSAYPTDNPHFIASSRTRRCLLVRKYGEPGARNLVVTAHSNHLLARRLNEAEGHADLYMLPGQAQNPYPYTLPETSIALKDSTHTLTYKKRSLLLMAETKFDAHQSICKTGTRTDPSPNKEV